jgi:hypothetical protein
MHKHTTHFDDCGCLSAVNEKKMAEMEQYYEDRLEKLQKELDEALEWIANYPPSKISRFDIFDT